MGIEYRITYESGRVADFDAFLKRQPYFVRYDPELKQYELRVPRAERSTDYADGVAVVESDGIYFCDYLTAKDDAAKILRSLIDEALRYGDRVSICEP